MKEFGQVYVKIAGREAGKFCVIIDVLENGVLIDGQVRRKKCNPAHLSPVNKSVDLKKGASHVDVVKAFEKIGLKITATKPKTKKGEKPVQKRKQHKQKSAEQAQGKKEAKEKPKKEAKKK